MKELERVFGQFGEDPVARQLKVHVEKSAPDDLFHMDVYGLADEWGIDRKDMLNLFLRGVRYGLFDMHWAFHCTHCGAIPVESLRLKEVHEQYHCAACTLDFVNTLDQNVEVFFNINDSIKKIPDIIKKGFYDEMRRQLHEFNSFSWRKPTSILGIDCINNVLFREIFGDDTLALDQSLEIKFTTIMFTDIKGSTRMYETLGDSRAFRLVREHFDVLFRNIERRDGVPIKTIGDAVMGVFISDKDAVTAALESQRELIEFYRSRPEEESIEVKIGLHSGPSLVVTLNGRLDYFGTTVNMAARIQGLARPNEVVFSNPLFEKKENRAIVARYARSALRNRISLKGLSGEYTIYRVNLADGMDAC